MTIKQYTISIDTGVNLGYAKFSDIDTLMNYGTLTAKADSKHYDISQVDRLMHILTCVFRESASFADHWGVKDRYCIIEGTFIGKHRKVSMDHAEMKGRIKSIATQYGFIVEEVHPVTWQKSMRLTDETAIDWVKATYPHFYGDRHAACAVAMAWYWLNKQYEKEILGI